MLILTIVIVLTIPYAWYLLKVIFAGGNILHQLEIFKWVAIGFVVFALLFNRKVLEFHANQGEGYMVSGYRNAVMRVPISLAPYCFPLYTFRLLSLRWMMDFHGMWIIDIIIVSTLCFHFYCFKTQIGNHQTDINQYPLLLSYSYILTSWLLVFCIIIPAFFPNMNGHGTVEPMYNYGVFSSMWRLLEAW